MEARRHLFHMSFHDRSLRPLVVALIPGQQRSLEKVKRMREEVSNELAEVINEFGPQMFDDFDEVRPSILILQRWLITLL